MSRALTGSASAATCSGPEPTGRTARHGHPPRVTCAFQCSTWLGAAPSTGRSELRQDPHHPKPTLP